MRPPTRFLSLVIAAPSRHSCPRRSMNHRPSPRFRLSLFHRIIRIGLKTDLAPPGAILLTSPQVPLRIRAWHHPVGMDLSTSSSNPLWPSGHTISSSGAERAAGTVHRDERVQTEHNRCPGLDLPPVHGIRPRTSTS